MPEGVFLDEAGLFPNANASPRTVLRAIEVNEPILATKVTEPGESAGVATALSPGMRAFTIDVNAETGVSGFLSPGDRVDVTWTGTVDNRQFSKIIQSSLKVIAIDQSADEDRLDPPAVANTVTVEVSPEVVAALAQARSTGLLSLSLVGALETTQATDVEVDQGTLLGIEQVVEEAPEEAEVCTVRRGVEIVEVPCP
jgi:pilus assembly protein CpaB